MLGRLLIKGKGESNPSELVDPDFSFKTEKNCSNFDFRKY